MAKIKFGMFMTDARGKVGGQVFSKNRGGAYVRTKVTPSNARTSRQVFIRSLLASISQKWSTLTASQRNSFNESVTSWATTDIFGDSRNPSGKSLFTKLNVNLVNSGQAQVTVAPNKIDIPIIGITSAIADISEEEITITATGSFAGGACVVFGTAPQSAGTNFFKGKYRQITTKVATLPTATELWDAYVAKFGAPKVGDNISLLVQFIGANGQPSVPVAVKLTTQL